MPETPTNEFWRNLKPIAFWFLESSVSSAALHSNDGAGHD